MSVRGRVASIALVVALAIVGAAMLIPAGAAAPSPGATPAAAVTYREAIVGHPNSVNPLTARTQADRDLVALLFRGLVVEAPDGSLQPDLARTWTVTADSLTYTFFLAGDAHWEDGRPVTAADVAFTVGLAQDPDYAGPLGASWQGITVAEVSTYVVSFTLPAPMGGFLRMAALPILPEHLLTGIAAADLAASDYSRQPVGDGPFRISELDSSHALLDRSSTSSTIAASTTPSPSVAPVGAIEAIRLQFYDDQAAAVAAFRSGSVDAVGGLAPDAADQAMSVAGSHLVRDPWANLAAVVLNVRASHPEMQSLKVRQGLLSAIDRPSLIAAVLEGRGSPADVALPAWSAAYDPKAVTVTASDAAAAATDLAAAGWTKGPTGWSLPKATAPYWLKLMTVAEATNPVLFRIAQNVAADWRSIGLSVTVEAVAASDYAARIQSGDFAAAIVNYRLGLDPDVGPLFLSSQVAPNGSNLSGVADPAFDALLSKVTGTTDPKARQAAISAVESYTSVNLPILPVCFTDYEFVVSSRVQGPVSGKIADPSDRFWDVIDWRLASVG
jgi:peptide/nickel transport system substrate-binding protein